jgi:hypothetical protein
MSVAPAIAAETIIFAINSAIKLSHNFKQLYAQRVREEDVVVPIPDFDPTPNLFRMHDFFEGLPAEQLEAREGLAALHKKAKEERDLNPEDLATYRAFFHELYAEQEGQPAPADLTQEELWALFRIQSSGEAEERSVLQLAAGSLVNIGVDYFVQVPGALNQDSVHGRILYHVLSAFDEIDFTEHELAKKRFSEQLLPRLFAATAEAVAEVSDEISNDPHFQALLKATAKGIANDIYARAEQLDPLQREEAMQWGQLLLRSVIKNAGDFVLSAPEVFFDTNTGASAIIQSSGMVLLEAILGDEEDKVSFKAALSPEVLDRLTRATLAILAEHPELITQQEGVRLIVESVAEAVRAEEALLEKGLLPELVRIVLEQSAGHLDQLWPDRENGRDHLLVAALQLLLRQLSEVPPAGQWQPRLTKPQLLDLIEELLDEVVHNPAWVLQEVDKKPVLAEVVRVTMMALRQIPEEERLQPEVFRAVLRLALAATITHPKIIEEIPWGEEGERVVVLQKAMELLVACVFVPEEAPQVNRLQLFMELLEYIVDVILREHPDAEGLLLVELLFDSGVDYSRGFDRRLADQLVDAALAVLANHPELAEKPGALRRILAGVFDALDSADIRSPHLAPLLVKLLLEQAAVNAHLIVEAEEGQPRHLLLIALRQILEALAAGENNGRWRPQVYPGQIEQLLSVLLDEVVDHPYWLTDKVQDDELLRELLGAVFDALEATPPAQRLTAETLEMLLRLCLRVVALSPRVLDEEWFGGAAEKEQVLQKALELVFAFVANPDENRARWLPELLEYALDVLLRRYPDKRGLILIDLILFEHNGIDYSRGFEREQAEALAAVALQVLMQHPDLVAKDQVLKEIIVNMARNLSEAGIEQPHLLRDLIHLALESTAEHIDLLLDDSAVNTRHLLIMASWQVLNALTQPVEDGEWKPRLSNAQIVDLIERMYEAILTNPRWAEQPLFHLLHAVFQAMQRMPRGTAIPYALLRHLIDRALEAANRQPALVLEIETASGEKQLRLQLALEAFVIELYGDAAQPTDEWYLSQRPVFELLADYYLSYLSATPASEQDIERARAQVREAIDTWREHLNRDLAEVIAAME